MPAHFLNNETRRGEIIGMIQNLDLSKPWIVEVKRKTNKRTLSQNALLHKWLQIIAEETGNSIDDVKEAYRVMFLGEVPVNIGDAEVMVGLSTTKLDTRAMSEFCDKVYSHATGELGLLLPLPEERHLNGRESSLNDTGAK